MSDPPTLKMKKKKKKKKIFFFYSPPSDVARNKCTRLFFSPRPPLLITASVAAQNLLQFSLLNTPTFTPMELTVDTPIAVLAGFGINSLKVSRIAQPPATSSVDGNSKTITAHRNSLLVNVCVHSFHTTINIIMISVHSLG